MDTMGTDVIILVITPKTPLDLSMTTLRVTQIGNSLGVILPKEITSHLHVGKGDVLFATLSPNGLEVSPYNAQLEAEIEMGQAFMNEYRETFKVLAK